MVVEGHRINVCGSYEEGEISGRLNALVKFAGAFYVFRPPAYASLLGHVLQNSELNGLIANVLLREIKHTRCLVLDSTGLASIERGGREDRDLRQEILVLG